LWITAAWFISGKAGGNDEIDQNVMSKREGNSNHRSAQYAEG
jgi:hypothetical protein